MTIPTDYYNTIIIYLLGGERERERTERAQRKSEEVTEVLFLRADLSILCLISVWCLSVSCFWLSEEVK